MKNKELKEDVDFGFPFVKVQPISSAQSKDTNLEEQKTIVSVSLDNEIQENLTVSTSSKSKSSTKIFIVLGFLTILLVVAAYFLFNQDLIQLPSLKIAGNNTKSVEASNKATVSEPKILQEEVLESPLETEITEIQAVKIEGEIVRIQNRIPGRYFLVVSSLINEKLAIAEADKYLGQGEDVYIIYPYGEITNYRVATGKFENIEDALEALEKAKKEINNSSWILKY